MISFVKPKDLCLCFTYQLELRAPCIGLLYAGIGPQRAQRHHVQLELTGLHARGPHTPLPRHHQHALLLILTALPGDAQLVPGIHQHTHALRRHKGATQAVQLSMVALFLVTCQGDWKKKVQKPTITDTLETNSQGDIGLIVGIKLALNTFAVYEIKL